MKGSNVVTRSPPTESAWSVISSSPSASTTMFRTTGGKLGFSNPSGGYDMHFGNLTLKSWDTATSAFDITEAIEGFAMDSNGYSNDTLISDDNGNQTYDGTQAYTYDAWNRLISVAHASRDSGGTLHTGQVSSSTSYDALGRRIVKTVTGTGQWDGTLNYYLDGNSVIEEQNGSAMTVKQFIWGNQYIDDLIQVSLNSSPSTQSTCDTPYWGMCDANWNVLGLVNSSGVLTERYEYTAYGQRTTYFSAGSNDPACYTSTDATSQRFVTSGSVTQFYGICEVGFQGLMHDEESGNIYSRAREDNSVLERWMEEDPFGYMDGLNLFLKERENPVRGLDASGLLTGSIDVDRYTTFDYYEYSIFRVIGVHFSVTWTPPDQTSSAPDPRWHLPCDCKPCSKVVWQQDISNDGGKTWKRDGVPDVRDARPWLCMINQPAWTSDDPYWEDIESVLDLIAPRHRRFKTWARCVAGPDKDKVYGTVEWGYDWSPSGTVTTVPYNIY